VHSTTGGGGDNQLAAPRLDTAGRPVGSIRPESAPPEWTGDYLRPTNGRQLEGNWRARMADIRHVVFSDLHFGATNSLLTTVVEPGGTFRAEPATPSPVLTACASALRHLLAGQDRRPTLVLAGDVLDLALSSDAIAITAFEGFVDQVFGGADRMFEPRVYYLPGNHDHHLWEGAREAQYISYLRALGAEDQIGEPWHTTRLLPEHQPPAGSDLMSALIQRRPGCADVSVQVVYPNLALQSRDRSRATIISHGHYSEPIYSLMSLLRETLFPDQGTAAPKSVAVLEGENFAWIDFFWSTLGRSGEVGIDVGRIYAELGNPVVLNRLAGNAIAGLVQKGHGLRRLRPVERVLATALAKREIAHAAASERSSPDVTLTPNGRTGLRTYLEGPVQRQVAEDLREVIGISVVFGHTHKPFVEQWTLAGYPGPVTIANTGGWVVDTARPAPVQGAVVVLIDDDLNLAPLQLYRQRQDGGADGVAVLGPPNPLHDALVAAIDPATEPWRSVQAAAAELVAQRHRLHAFLAAGGAAATPDDPDATGT
jgi:UDP-2,3-diacylglucosamine pyrophosphatase LpxH